MPTSPPLSSSLKDRGRGKKEKREKKNKRQGRNWNLQGWLWCCYGYNCKAETLNGSAVWCRTKNTSFSFIQLPLSNTHIINIYYRWPYHTDLIKDEETHLCTDIILRLFQWEPVGLCCSTDAESSEWAVTLRHKDSLSHTLPFWLTDPPAQLEMEK